MEKFLPVRKEKSTGAYKWPENVMYALLALAKGTIASEVTNGEALYDCIQDMQRESSLLYTQMSRHTSDGLSLFFDDLMSHADAQRFFKSVLPAIAELALRFPALLGTQQEALVKFFSQNVETTVKPTPAQNCQGSLRPDMVMKLLYTQQPGIVVLSQEMVASLLACSFLCLFPTGERWKEHLPSINIDRLFAGVYERGVSNEHKLLCILHYFDRVCGNMPQGVVSFERKVLPVTSLKQDGDYWSSSRTPLCPVTVLEEGTIEDEGRECLQLDFANRMLGGGALADGCVQEEIRFMINPELIAGMLFLPAMAANESIEIIGAERYSCYRGYASSFRFTGDFIDSTPRDAWHRRQTRIIAIDALSQPGETQFQLKLVMRELNKAYCGFLDTASWGGDSKALPLSSEVSNGMQIEGSYGQGREAVLEAIGSSRGSDVFEFGGRFNGNEDPDLSGEAVGMLIDVQGSGCQTQIPEGIAKLRSDTMESEVFDREAHLHVRSSIGIATGNWGCGVFCGNLELKSLLQWLAASQAGRPYMLYFSFQNPGVKRLQEVADRVLQEGWCVGELWSIVTEYGRRRQFHINLFDWILPQPGTDLSSLLQ